METQIKTLIENNLNIPCFLDDQATSITFPSATLSIYSESQGLHGDGHGVSTVCNVQIDLWYTKRTDRDTATSTLFTVLNGLPRATTPEVERFFDTTARKFRATFHFESIKEE